jgi:hypothetical protein
MAIDLRALPTFNIERIQPREHTVELTGKFIGPASESQWKRCYLYVGRLGLVHCRILKIGQSGTSSVLEVWPEEAGGFQIDDLQQGSTYGYLAPIDAIERR